MLWHHVPLQHPRAAHDDPSEELRVQYTLHRPDHILTQNPNSTVAWTTSGKPKMDRLAVPKVAYGYRTEM